METIKNIVFESSVKKLRGLISNEPTIITPLPNINPMAIPDVLDRVLQYVGTNTKDLIECRLVNHSWNDIIVELLKNKGVTIAINEQNVGSYRHCLEKSEFGRKPPISSLKTNLKVFVPSRTLQKVNSENRIGNGFMKELQLLVKRHNCRIEHIIDVTNQLDFTNFAQLLHLSSASLESLYLKPIKGRRSRVDVPNVESMELPDSFPYLTSIEYNLHASSSLDYATTPIAFIKIIECSPKLESLIIPEHSPINMKPYQLEYDLEETIYEKQRLYVTEIVRGLVRLNNEIHLGLTNLEIPIYNSVILVSLCRLGLPKLKKLVLHQKYICLPSRLFGSFLVNNCPRLESLELYFLPFYAKYYIGIEHNNFDPLLYGEVQHITSVGFYFGIPGNIYSDYLVDVDTYAAPLIASVAILAVHFPSVTCISTDVLAFSALARALRTSDNSSFEHFIQANYHQYYLDNLQFPNVSTLRMTQNESTTLSMSLTSLVDMHATLSNITTFGNFMVPALTKLVLNFDGGYGPPKDLCKWVGESGLRGILGIEGIQSIEIYDYFDWLPYLIEKTGDDVQMRKLCQTLVHLKFGESKVGRQVRQFYKSPLPPSILKTILGYFSNLKLVQIENQLVRKARIGHRTKFVNILKILNELVRGPFPNIKIELI